MKQKKAYDAAPAQDPRSGESKLPANFEIYLLSSLCASLLVSHSPPPGSQPHCCAKGNARAPKLILSSHA